MTSQQALMDYCKVLYALAWADKKLQQEELILLREIINSMGFSEEEMKIIEKWEEIPISQEEFWEINFASFSIEQKKHILLLAISVAKADGLIVEDEEVFIENLKKALTLENITEGDLVQEIKNSIELYGTEVSHTS